MASIDSHEASPSTSLWSHPVYLSFNGSDTSDTFIDHLCKDLMHHELRPFRDDDEQLERGREDIKPILQKAIEESRVSIIVLSKNYASSRWCLDRLVMILKCRSLEHVVLPVFYGIDRSEVRDHTGKFKEAFAWHEMKIEMAMGDQQKEYWMEKVQEWRMALKEVANSPGYEFGHEFQKAFHRESEIVQRICFDIGNIAKSNRAQLGRQDRCDSIESHPKEETTKEKRKKREMYSYDFSFDILQQHFGSKREDVAKSLDISISTLKRICRSHGIPRWPNRKRSSVSGLPSSHREKTPLPTFNTLSTNGQIRMEKEVGGHSEPNECPPHSLEDTNLQITMIEDLEKNPTCYDSVPDHYHNTNICVSAFYSETEAAKGSSEWVFQPEGETTQSTAYPNSNALLFQRPHLASEVVLNENSWTSEDRRDSLASQEAASFEGHPSESSNLTVPALSDLAAPSQPLGTILHPMSTIPPMVPHPVGSSSERAFQLEHLSRQFPDCPNLSSLVAPHPQIASTEILDDLEYSANYLLSEEHLLAQDGYFFTFDQVRWESGCSTQSSRIPCPPTPQRRDTTFTSVGAVLGQHALKLRVSFATGIIQLKKEVSKRLSCFRPKPKKIYEVELRAC